MAGHAGMVERKKVFATVVIGRGELPIFELWGVW